MKWKRICLKVVRNPLMISPLVIFIIAIIAMYFPGIIGLDKQLAGEISGAALGVSGLIAALGVERFMIRKEQELERQSKVKKIIYVIGTELVNVASGMMSYSKLLVAAIITKNAGGFLPEKDDLISQSRPMLFFDMLGENILLLREEQVEALFLLKSRLQFMDDKIQELSKGRYAIDPLCKLVIANLELLSEAFEKVVPTRQLKDTNHKTQLASIILRNEAQILEGALNSNGKKDSFYFE